VAFAGGGAATTVARSDHDHPGETWSGGDVGLTLENNNTGLKTSAGQRGIHVDSPGFDGVYVNSPGTNGVVVRKPGEDGVRVNSASGSGFYASSPAVNGLRVGSSGGAGVYISWSGTSGVVVEAATNDGVDIISPGRHGFRVSSSGGDGVNIWQPRDDGVQVDYPFDDGVVVTSPEGNGVVVDRPGRDGIDVFNATRYGVYADTDATYGFFTHDKIYAGDGYVDIAEHIDAASDVEPGDVVVIDPEHDERVVKSTQPYDSSVAGIISTDPALLIGKPDSETPLALAGRVRCKVSAENGPIRRGDLLTTSGTPGHAMKATEPQLGTILGKAMGELGSGTGVIVVLVTLQ
jgi:hypothetical protein